MKKNKVIRLINTAIQNERQRQELVKRIESYTERAKLMDANIRKGKAAGRRDSRMREFIAWSDEVMARTTRLKPLQHGDPLKSAWLRPQSIVTPLFSSWAREALYRGSLRKMLRDVGYTLEGGFPETTATKSPTVSMHFTGADDNRLDPSKTRLSDIKIFPDGNQWCAMRGDGDIGNSICGFGPTPNDAVLEFLDAWETPNVKPELPQ